MKYDLAIIIVNYRTPAMTIECLASLMSHLPDSSIRIVVVDNNSGDDSVKAIESWCLASDVNSIVNIISSPENLGFSGGNNIGIRHLSAEYYLLLNSDTLVRKDAIKEMLTTAEKYPKAGLIGPRLEWPDGKAQVSCFRYITPISELIEAAQTGPVTKLLKRFDVPIPVSNEFKHPDWTSFACVLIRENVFENIGLMDESFFMYFEDVEFCYRARKAGWDIVHNPAAHIVHLHGGSSGLNDQAKMRKRLPRYYYESRTLYFNNHFGRIGLTIANLLWWAGRCISWCRELVGNKRSHTCKHQWLDIWTNWFTPKKNYTKP